MSDLNEKINNRARGSGAMPVKLTACVMYGLRWALFFIYIMHISVFPHQ